jgi:tRNA dimethylallyltransferase
MSSPAESKTVLVVAGPTASGKSALAVDLADAVGGVVINADSMQVYRELRILTARPSAADEARVPHRLFGVLPASERGSAAWWRDAASAEIDAAFAEGRVPILCGGTGLYLAALMRGLADVPAVADAVVREAVARYEAVGGAAFREEVRAVDPVLGDRLEPGDSQRLQRAWAVARATGRPLSSWQAETHGGRADLAFRTVLLFPPRPASADAVDARFRRMVDTGAIAEVRALLALALDRSLPAMRAIGVPQLTDFIERKCSLDRAIEAAVIATRQYAKRQRTWFRHQFVSDLLIGAQYLQSDFAKIFSEIRSKLLTG